MFKFIDYLTINKISWEELTHDEKKEFNPYVLNLFLMNHVELIHILNEVQYYRLSNEQVYKIYHNLLPKRKYYTKFLKGKSKYTKELINFISQYYSKSRKDSIELLDSLNKEEILTILRKCQIQEKEILKLTKEL